MSILERWYPVTSDFGLIQAPLERVVVEFENSQASLGTQFARAEITDSLEEALRSLLPLANSKMRRLFVSTDSDWVACFQNGIAGSDPFPAMSLLSKRLSVLAMRVCATPQDAKYPANVWELYAPQSLGGSQPLGYRRSIAALNDGGRWVFEETGDRFPFEQVERYASLRKRDRFTADMLRDYVANFGIRLFEDSFFRIESSAPAVRLQQLTNTCATPEFTLEEVIAGKPWETARSTS